MEQFASTIKDFLYATAEFFAYFLEFIGIAIIIIGSFRALIRLIQSLIKRIGFHVVIELGRALSLALEFKMGAEIIKTVIIHNLEELAILGFVVLLRAILLFIIHWEIHLEEKSNKNTK